jgi:D-alanyl-D-alanine carboxypeptidase/D-alanyl-D-alanine-endopeptidase (penicillin-binding protein 4)
LEDRNFPVFTYRSVNGLDYWSVAKSALGKSGSRWLPVRQPADYAGEVFRSIAAYNGVRMPEHEVSGKLVAGTEVAVWESRDLQATVKSMIKYSTNLTAETLGMNATIKHGETAGTLRHSAKVMSKWLEAQYGVRGAKFVDHSGLGADSRISGHEMARLLVNAKWDGPLRPLMKEITLRNSKGKKSAISGTKLVVKTGTLNFTSALAGYVTCPNGRKLVFAVFTTDMKKRAKIAKKDRERPPGTRRWVRNSRAMQRQLLRHWVQSYGV